MYRLLGGILILAGCVAFGFQKSFELQLHIKELEELKSIFLQIKSKIQYEKCAFQDLFQQISTKANGVFRFWLHGLALDLNERNKGTFQEVWEQRLGSIQNETKLTKSEIDELMQVGKTLSNMGNLDMYLGQLEFAIEKARKDAADKKKIYQSMGFLGGIFLVILLL